MQPTIGAVLFYAVLIFGSLIAGWAGAVLAAILFPERTLKASKSFEDCPWKTFWLGLLFVLPLGALALALTSGGGGILGIPLLLALLAVAIIGFGGLARLVARRIDDHSGATSSYQAIVKGAALIAIAELLPVFGWFFIFPFVLVTSFGAGLKTLFKKRVLVEVPTTTEAE